MNPRASYRMGTPPKPSKQGGGVEKSPFEIATIVVMTLFLFVLCYVLPSVLRQPNKVIS